MNPNNKPTVNSEATRLFTIIDGQLNHFICGVWTFCDDDWKSSGQELWVDGFIWSGECDEEGVWELRFSSRHQYETEPRDPDYNYDSYDGYYRDSDDCICSASHFDCQ